jgi:hypothetical protein
VNMPIFNQATKCFSIISVLKKYFIYKYANTRVSWEKQ